MNPTSILFAGYAAYASSQARDADNAAQRASASAAHVRAEVELLQADIEKLLIISEALWTLLREAHGYSDEKLLAAIEAVDLRDGRLDGKVAKSPPLPCPRCGKPLPVRRPLCIYCGAAAPVSPFKR